MFVSVERLAEFISVYKKEMGEELTEGEARAMIERFVPLYKLLLSPIPGEEPSVQQRTAGIKLLHEGPDILETEE